MHISHYTCGKYLTLVYSVDSNLLIHNPRFMITRDYFQHKKKLIGNGGNKVYY